MTGNAPTAKGPSSPTATATPPTSRVTHPDGTRRRKWAYGRTREEVHDKWLTLHAAAKRDPSSPRSLRWPTTWRTGWPRVIKPNREPNTYSQYELFSRRYIIPGLGTKRVDRLTVRDVQTWLNKLRSICRCCTRVRMLTAVRTSGAAARSGSAAATIRASAPSKSLAIRCAPTALGMAEELDPPNVATMAKLPAARKTSRRGQSWGVGTRREGSWSSLTPIVTPSTRCGS